MNLDRNETSILDQIGVEDIILKNIDKNEYLTSTVPLDEEGECLSEESPRNDISINDTLLS